MSRGHSATISHRGCHSFSARRGTIFITTIWVTIILSALVLVFARSMRLELTASGNRVGAREAAAVERGAEQYVLSQVDGTAGDAMIIVNAPAEAMQVGDGYFWILRPNGDNPRQYTYGITDESSKVNVNSATNDQMLKLPGMSNEASDSITDWRDADENITGQGGESQYYQSLQPPYRCKNAPLESVEELQLVKGITNDLLWGSDLNRNGVIDPSEEGANGSLSSSGMGAYAASPRGIFPDVTVYSVMANTASGGTARVNINQAPTPTAGQPGATPTPPTPAAPSAAPTATPTATPTAGGTGTAAGAGNDPLLQLLQSKFAANRATEINTKAAAGRPFKNPFDFAVKTGLTTAEFKLVADLLTTNPNLKTVTGAINVNTAPREVLLCLPGLEAGDADAILAKRGGSGMTNSSSTLGSSITDGGDMSWVMDAISKDKAVAIGGAITGRSYQYSADIVAVSNDGRAYRRVRIVVDGRQSPAKIVYRRDLTSYGWPLPDDIRTSLRAGEGLPSTVQSNQGTSTRMNREQQSGSATTGK